MRRWLGVTLAVGALGLVACGGEATPPDPAVPKGGGGAGGGTEACEPPARDVAGTCTTAGLQDDGCLAGQWLVDGTCADAGIPPLGCSDGFVVVDDHCEAQLVADCPEGEMAIPGDAACRPPMPCGEGPWGDIPVDGNTVYVDASYAAGMSDGSADHPYATVKTGLAMASDGGNVAVAAGLYAEGLIILNGKTVALRGVCPEQVVLSHPGTFGIIIDDADGSEVSGMTIQGAGIGIGVTEDVLLSGLHIVDTGSVGVLIGANLAEPGPSGAILRDVLVERAFGSAVMSNGGTLDVDRLEIRDTQLKLGKAQGIALQYLPGNGPPLARLRRVRIQRSHDVGMFTVSTEIDLESVAILDTEPNGAGELGYGMAIQRGGDGAPATIRGLHVASSHGVGLLVSGVTASLESLFVTGTQPLPQVEQGGQGLAVRADPGSGEESDVDLAWSVLSANHEAGLGLFDSPLRAVGSILRDTKPSPGGGLGHGINVLGAKADLELEGSRIHDNVAMGLQINDGQARLRGVEITTTASGVDALYGDAVVVVSELAPASLEVMGSVLANSERAGLSSFGGLVTLGGTHLSCNLIALVVETYGSFEAAITNEGSNLCSCAGEATECKAQAAMLTPPPPLPPPPDEVPEDQ